ncbi:ABC transporter ATP-binding protein [Actinomyces slackii]|uniref:Multidrug resistance ABC transporter ATP-binding/permease protein BmrA n=1 Tax=Actinomyces slackii TaxID=52774 RepID=A0A448KAQ5_9ACTO|nr:ABC transporter ATP-binding protein [Actinomyces slackii]VEG74011.1 Multidrug resistance ABC transporter ATP-binding/permease protein BmrA [Actinomyces slackii]
MNQSPGREGGPDADGPAWADSAQDLESGPRLRQLWPFLRPLRARIVLGIVLALAGAVASLAQPIVMAQVINATLLEESVARPFALLALLLLLDVVLSGLQAWVLLRAGEDLVLTVRTLLIERIIFWRLPTLRRHRSGDLISRVSNDAGTLRGILSDGTVDVVGSVFMLGGAIWIMIVIDPVLFGCTVAALVLAGASAVALLPQISRETERSNKELGVLSADLDRAVTGFITVITSGMRSLERERLAGDARASWRAGRRAAAWDALTTPILLLGMNLGFLVVFGVGGVRVAEGRLGVAEFISFILYFGILTPPIIMGMTALTTVQRCLGAVGRISEVLDEPVEDPVDGLLDRHYVPDEGSPPFSAALSDVTFRYSMREAPVLDSLSLELETGGLTALLGESGSGKTTTLYLLAGLERPDSGEVLIDGEALTEERAGDVLDGVAVVQQETPVFWGTVRDNLCYGVFPEPSVEEVDEVVERLGLRPLVDSLPGGLDSHIEDHGVSLSGGERQRIAIARALLRRPRLLLLDEPTAQLDGHNERRLLEALRTLRGRTTVMLSTHRSSTAAGADKVVQVSPAGTPVCQSAE